MSKSRPRPIPTSPPDELMRRREENERKLEEMGFFEDLPPEPSVEQGTSLPVEGAGVYDSAETNPDHEVEKEIGELLNSPQRMEKRLTPPHLQNEVGQAALKLWRKQGFLMSDKQDREWWVGKFLDWWLWLDDELRERIDSAIAAFPTCEAFRSAYLKYLRPEVVVSSIGPQNALFDALLNELPPIDFDVFAELLNKPVGERSAYAEEFDKQVTTVLKDYLGVISGRPRTKPSPAELDDDKYLRRLAAYIWNFPLNFFQST
jgi:hypothetical protein